MEPDQLLHEREPDAGAFVGAPPRAPDPVEPLEDVRELGGRDPDPRVAYLQERAVARLGEA